MARFEIGDRVRINITIGSIYNKVGTITGYAQMHICCPGECYPTPRWRVELDTGDCISVSENCLNPAGEDE